MIRRILYSSCAADGICMRDVYDIIRVAHNRNSKAGVTGGLILLDGYFYQLLEGLPAAVEQRFARIQRDPRHRDLNLRLDESAAAPVFESDWMALRDGSQVDPQVLIDHHYRQGMPTSHCNEQQVLALLVACFDKELAEADLKRR